MGEVCGAPRQSVALGRQSRRHFGVTARRSATKHVKKFWAATSSTQCLGKFLGLGIGGVSMKTAAHYRAMAEECIKWAGEAYTAEVRESYLQLARIWLDTASRLNGLSANEVAPEEPITTARSAD